MTGRLLVILALTGAVAAPAVAQAPVQLYPRAAPAVPPSSLPDPARPVTPPEPLPPIAPPPTALPRATPPPAASAPAPPPNQPATPRGIAVTPLPPSAPPPSVQPPPAPPPPPMAPGDAVLAAVEGFYGALGRGDGQLANEFLVPEKRNQGAYEVASMTRFYSAMREPLRVLGVGRLDPDIVRVQYAYVHESGRRCDGVADVTVRRVGGRALIERIRALSGC